jgi:Ca-activated chloride channel family protein
MVVPAPRAGTCNDEPVVAAIMFQQLSAFHFLRPQWLWLLVPAALLYFVILRREDVSRRWKDIVAPPLLEKLLIRPHRRWRFRPIHSICLTIGLSAIGMAGPAWTLEQPPFIEDKAALVIALDISRDMDAIDSQPTRLERAKLKIHDLMKIRQGSRTGLFVYSATAHMVLPLTADASLMDLYAQSLSTDLIRAGTKDTASALQQIRAMLNKEPVPGTILFITYGVERKAFPAFSQYANGAHQILILGVGTTQGGPLRSASGQFVSESGRRLFSRLDLDGLKALKAEANIPVSTLTLDDDDVKWVERSALSHLRTVQQRQAKAQWVDQGYWLILPVALLAALWFRKGWTIRWVTASLGLSFVLHPSSADGRDFHFIDLWLTPDQQGRYYFEKGDYATASQRFYDPMWKGLALCRQGDYQQALDQFALLDTAESWFNQGNALAHLQKYPEAVKAYKEALKQRHDWREAQDNLRLLQALIPPEPPKPDQQEEAPSLKPDQVKFDKKGKKGKKARVGLTPEQVADVWMRNIQTSPADFLRRKFAIEDATGRRP